MLSLTKSGTTMGANESPSHSLNQMYQDNFISGSKFSCGFHNVCSKFLLYLRYRKDCHVVFGYVVMFKMFTMTEIASQYIDIYGLVLSFISLLHKYSSCFPLKYLSRLKTLLQELTELAVNNSSVAKQLLWRKPVLSCKFEGKLLKVVMGGCFRFFIIQ